MTQTDRKANAALAPLIALQLIMLGSLYAGVAPHPPAAIPLFAMGPFLGASVGAAAAAMFLGPGQSTLGRALALLAGAMALVSFGPQKYLDVQFALIWPAVIAAQASVIGLVVTLLAPSRRRVAQPG
ncbi:hypothetical protein [Pararhodobacter sp. CCB-MM2]|uniref:hypothetical protein n=1 Tax=Pararhodobacter sp. CCB-MM2 TaxID=1786003 RepID=UPI00082B54C3|nr:hypothetical protein [Pararhodobacter sp. CCB-MM2]